MHGSRIAAIPRLSRNAIHRLLDQRAAIRRRSNIALTAGDRLLGRIEHVIWQRESVTIEGWCTAKEIEIGIASGTPEPLRPWIERHDIAHAIPDVALRTGFQVTLERIDPRSPVAVSKQGEVMAQIPPPSPGTELGARVAGLPGALAYAAGHTRDVVKFIRTGDAGLSVALRDAFGLAGSEASWPLAPHDLFGPQAPPSRPSDPVTVLIPVYNAPGLVRRLLARLADTIDIPHNLLFVDDGSDRETAGLIEAFAQPRRNAVIQRFETNRGFVAAVNSGLAHPLAENAHVILLNTDTVPPQGWASRLMEPILREPGIASVTPLSNEAEIASIPAQGVTSALTPRLVDQIDNVARRLTTAEITLPTGIGFAMAMNRAFIDKVGGFDPDFGRGYGEEVDWCQRAIAVGGRHALAANLFIGHDGGGSFGATEKSQRIAHAARTISSRYPGYDRAVQTWAERAPHGVARLALSVAWLDANATEPLPIFVAHTLKGGAEFALQREIAEALESGARGAIILRAGGSASWCIEVVSPHFHHCCRIQDSALLLELLAPVRQRRVVYSCAVGARDGSSVPDLLLALADTGPSKLEMRLHDYFAVHPSYCLLDDAGRYTGVPTHGVNGVSPTDWKRCWGRVIDRATQITAFSASSAEIFQDAYPQAEVKLMIAPHPMPTDMPEAVKGGGKALGILGALNQAKGADILAKLAKTLNGKRRIVVIGDLDPNFRLDSPHLVTGPYQRSQISDLAKAHDVGAWLIPSIWPETFSFTTREALATGLPVLAFDLGAQGEAVRAAQNGQVIASHPDDIPCLVRAIEAQFSA